MLLFDSLEGKEKKLLLKIRNSFIKILNTLVFVFRGHGLRCL